MTAGRKAVRAVALGLVLAPLLAVLAGCERKTAAKPVEARPVRTIKEVQEGTAVGELLRRDLIRSQLKLTLRFAALTVLERTLAAVAEEFRGAGKGEVFEALKVYLVGEVGAPGYAEVGRRLSMSEGAVKVAVHRLRERYRSALRREIAATVSSEAEVDREIADLFAALGG